MRIIVAGTLSLTPGSRDEFINKSIEAISVARNNKRCLDFSVSPDPIEEKRINIFELWENRQALETFRQSGPENDLFSLVQSFNVSEYEVP